MTFFDSTYQCPHCSTEVLAAGFADAATDAEGAAETAEVAVGAAAEAVGAADASTAGTLTEAVAVAEVASSAGFDLSTQLTRQASIIKPKVFTFNIVIS